MLQLKVCSNVLVECAHYVFMHLPSNEGNLSMIFGDVTNF